MEENLKNKSELAETFDDPSPSPDSDQLLAVLCDALQDAGVELVCFKYNGYGDSGSIEDITWEPEESEKRVPKAVRKALEDLIDSEYLPAGYENDEGGQGEFRLWPRLGQCKLHHENNFQESQEEEVSCEAVPDELLTQLRTLGVESVELEYYGSGDSGSFEAFRVEPDSLSQAVQSLIFELENWFCEQIDYDWYNNEGGHGTCRLDVLTGEASVEGYSKVIEQDCEDTYWTLKV